MRQKETEIPDAPLKRSTHRFTCTRICTLGICSGSMTQEAQETYGERLHCMVPKQRLEGQLPLFFYQALLQSRLQTGSILFVLNPPPAHPILKLHWSREISPPQPTPKLLRAAHGQKTTLPCLFVEPRILLRHQTLATTVHAFQRKQLLADHYRQNELLYGLGGSQGSVDPS